MRAVALRAIVAAAVTASAVVLSPAARANDMDPVLARMWQLRAGQIETRDDLYDALALEIAYAMAPNVHYPAETLGWSGFFIGLEATMTMLDPNSLHLVCGVENLGGAGDGGDAGCDTWGDNVDLVAFVPAIHVRKGLPYSLELGFQIQYMANSELVALGGEVRWAPFEGYRTGWLGWLPDLSIAFTGNYLMGSSELAMGMLGGNVALSYPFTISGEMTLTPYAGWQFIIVGQDHEQVFNSYYVEHGENPPGATTTSPYLDFHGGRSRNFGQQLASLKFHRIFFGVRILWEHLAVTPQLSIAMPMETGSAGDTGVRVQLGLSIGSDF